MYECAGVDRRTWDRFVDTIKKHTLQKPNSSCLIDPTTKKCITGAHNTKYYHPKVEEAFQLWLKKNAINAGGQRTEGSIIKQEIHNIVDNSGYKYSKEDICSICNVDEKTFRRFFEEVRLDSSVQPKVISERDFISVGSSHKKLYTETVLQKFQLWLMKNQANQGKTSQVVKQATTQAVEKDLVITEVIKSGNVEAFNQLMNQYKLAFDTAQENKRLLEQTKQMEHALNYTAVIGWKKWSDLKKELAQNFEIFQHRISFKTVAAEAGLVKETDYAERIYGEDCFPTTMISESGIDKIYNCYDR